VVVCLEQGANLLMAQLMPLPLTVSCLSKIQIGFTFLVSAHLGSPGKRAVKRVCVCVCSHRPQTSPPVCYSLHHKVTGLRLAAASATAHGLARLSRLAAPSGRLAGCSSVTSAPLHMAHDVIHKTGST